MTDHDHDHEDEDHAAAFYALDPEARLELAAARLRDEVAATAATLDREDAPDELRARGMISDALPGEQRSFELTAELAHGRLSLRLPVRNPRGGLALARCFDDEPQDVAWFGDPRHAVVIAHDDGLMAQLPAATVGELASWIDDEDVDELWVNDDTIGVSLYGFVYEPLPAGWLPRLLAPMSRLARVTDGRDLTCAFCGGRFVPDAGRSCPRCGGRMT